MPPRSTIAILVLLPALVGSAGGEGSPWQSAGLAVIQTAVFVEGKGVLAGRLGAPSWPPGALPLAAFGVPPLGAARATRRYVEQGRALARLVIGVAARDENGGRMGHRIRHIFALITLLVLAACNAAPAAAPPSPASPTASPAAPPTASPSPAAPPTA
ncbi:MAG: hypothetical protein HGA45_19365, partial [Chloroflexales bacterium]|nr:hypothetical protein [Chloroflexales bacterium]